jgi:hypothetical protein
MRSGARTIFSRFVPLGFLMVDLVATKTTTTTTIALTLLHG